MRQIRLAVLLGTALLAACAAPGLTGPQAFDGVLQGDITDGVYHDHRHWFAVGVPFGPRDPEYGDVRIREEYPRNVTLVSFLALHNPGEYYYAYIEDFTAGGHPIPGLDALADSAIRVFGRELMETRVEPLELVKEEPWTTAHTQGLMRLYHERVPSELLMQDLGMAEDYTAYILMYVTVQSGKVVMLWAEWPTGCSVCTPVTPGAPTTSQDPIARALAEDARAQTFLDSFQYTPEANAP